KIRMGKTRWVSYVALIILAIGSVGLAKAPSVKAEGDNSPLAQQLKKRGVSTKEKEKRLAAMRSSIAAQKKADKNKAAEESSSKALEAKYAS
ncbi:acetyltransferase, partial [Lacticaseibacillus paracasei]